MKRTTDILFFLTATLLLLAGCGKQRVIDNPQKELGQGDSYPVHFGISANLEVASKSAITDDNVTDYSFTALGNLTVDTEQQTGLFGVNGTVVSHNGTAWTYSPVRYWQPGSYDFAAVMPSGVGTASFSGENVLTLDFGDEGFNLAENQADLMVAFDSQEVANASAAKDVSLSFEHQFAMVSIEGINNESRGQIRIDEIKLYGNHAATSGNIVFTYDESSISSEYELDGETNTSNVYMTFSDSWLLSAAGTTQTYTTLIPELLVFPEECDFSIIVTYTDYYGSADGVKKIKTGTLSANWMKGYKYTYKFSVDLDKITFNEPSVEPWSDAGAVDTDIEM